MASVPALILLLSRLLSRLYCRGNRSASSQRAGQKALPNRGAGFPTQPRRWPEKRPPKHGSWNRNKNSSKRLPRQAFFIGPTHCFPCLYATLIHLYKKGRIHTERKKYFFSDHAYPENVFTFRTFHNALQEALKKGCVPDTIGIAVAEGASAEKRL